MGCLPLPDPSWWIHSIVPGKGHGPIWSLLLHRDATHSLQNSCHSMKYWLVTNGISSLWMMIIPNTLAADHLLWQHSWGFALTGRHMFERAERVQALPKLRPMVSGRHHAAVFSLETLDVFSSEQMGKSSLRRGTVGLLKNRSTAKSSCNRILAFLGECDLRDCLVWVKHAPEKMGYHNPQSTS